MLAEIGETWVITRANNRPAIERELEASGAPENVHFVFVDLPPSVRRLKRGQRGLRPYYLLWQFAALREARRMGREKPFDIAWHVTLANAWLGSGACFLNIPFVYGPVGGGIDMPWRLAKTLGTKGVLYELARTGARGWGRYLNPLARVSWRKASLILALNEDTKQWLPQRHRAKTEVFPNVLLDSVSAGASRGNHHVMLYGGRLLPWKGVSYAVRALVQLPGWRLVVCGDGPDAARLRRLATSLGVADRVDFRGWVERAELHRVMREEASVFVLPSLHDDSPWVVVEAMAAGLPVVCLGLGGPPKLVGDGTAVRPAGCRVTVERIAHGVLAAAEADSEVQRERAREFLLENRLAQLRQLLPEEGSPCPASRKWQGFGLG